MTFEFTLLTFCPPGPLLRAVEMEISSLGIVRRALTYKSAMIPLYPIAAYIVRRNGLFLIVGRSPLTGLQRGRWRGAIMLVQSSCLPAEARWADGKLDCRYRPNRYRLKLNEI